MQEALRALQLLQEVDKDLYRVRAELERLPREREAARLRLEGLRTQKRDLDERVRTLRARVKEIDDETSKARQRVRKVESEALKNRGDVALQAAFQHEARGLKREISTSEEEGLRLLEDVEAFAAQSEALAAALVAEERDFAELSANVAAEIEAARARAASMEAERARRFSGDLQPQVVSTYERLLEVREGQALALLENRICQGCYMEVPPNLYVRVARGVELVQCPNCGRFLYLTRI